MEQSMVDATRMIVQANSAIITQPLGTAPVNHYLSALKCIQAWMSFFTGECVQFLLLVVHQLKILIQQRNDTHSSNDPPS